jgi:hypothetical protein
VSKLGRHRRVERWQHKKTSEGNCITCGLAKEPGRETVGRCEICAKKTADGAKAWRQAKKKEGA